MKYFRLLSLLLVILPGIHVTAQAVMEYPFAQYSNNGEVYFKLQVLEKELFESLSKVASIDHLTEDGWVYGYANEDQFQKIMKHHQSAPIEWLPHPGTLISPKMITQVDIQSIDEWDFYPTYEAYVDMMYQFQEDFPALCEVHSIGQSTEGHEILMAVISNNTAGNASDPKFLYTSTMHGDETAGYILFLRLIHYLLNNYSSDDQVKNLVNNLEIWINPLANPDGTYASGNNTVFGATRFNANGVDLNRNFPDPEDGPHPDGNEWQQETLMFMELAENNNFVASANIHGGTEVCNYPWDTWAQLHADDDWWQYVCHEYADTAQAYSPNGYMSGYNDGITNGYQWYTISGGRQDYMNYFHHCREFTLEISDTKLLPGDQLPDFWEYNYRSFLNYMQQALFGIRGIITDVESGDPLEASVFIENHDADESWIVSNDAGWFFRPVFEGTYDLTFYKPGYAPQTIENIQIANYEITNLEVQLSYTGSGINDNPISDLFTVGNNPGHGIFQLVYLGDDPLDFDLEVWDLKGAFIFKLNISTTSNSMTQIVNLENYTNGVYLLTMNTEKHSGTFKLIKN